MLFFKQADVAERAGVSQSFYSTIERGRRDPSFAVKLRIAAALEADIAVLFPDK